MYSIGINTLNGLELSLFAKHKCVDFISKLKNECMVADEIIPQMQNLLLRNKISLDDITFAFVLVGPGYFTGIRIGVVVAKILQSSLQKPCIPINSLQAMSRQQLSLSNSFLSNKNEYNKNNYIFACCDIGKQGFVLAVYSALDEVILEAKYYEETIKSQEIETLLKTADNIIIVGEKQDACYQYLLTIINNNKSFNNSNRKIIVNNKIMVTSRDIAHKIAYNSYMENQKLREVEAFYGNAFTIVKSQ